MVSYKRIVGSTLDSPWLFRNEYYKDAPTNSSLKGGYLIYYVRDSLTNYVYIKRGKNTRLIRSQSNWTSFDNLGKVLEDYESYFLFGHDNGNGCPYTIELIDKISLKNLLGTEMTSLNYDYLPKNYLLYYDDVDKKMWNKFILHV